MKKLRKQTLDGNVETLLLAILQSGPNYGYAMVKELNNRAEGILELGEGTVYPVLHRLENKGLISASWFEAENSRERKYYRLTAKGRKALAANRVQWQMLSEVMAKVLGPVGEATPSPLAKGAML